ncbi:hypothetical protein [Clostridium tagluense]|uniref:hypothetical protein n=1 Tax=Clostridium tagluense TaxID=360422 RepID=UPI001C6E495F|nr:hypothetical protein [Clostridium tagluense]MBW9159650.1 hypothetical protein [Clostridium tagluense]WLC68316.1 hypothetical protein KTC93_25450 [Clostridium tagluense]
MKSINSSKTISIICYGVSSLIFLVIGLEGVFLSAGDEMGYCVLYFYIVMPLTTLIASFIISMKKGYLFWFYPAFVSLLEIIISFVVFSTFGGIDLFFAFFPALIGLIVGLIIRFKTKKELKMN